MSNDRVIIFDTTLRDGEQAAGAAMTAPQKLQIAALLDEMGVDVIEAGYAGASEMDKIIISQIARQTSKAVICSLARCIGSDIAAAADALKNIIHPADPSKNRGRIHVFCATSDIHMKDKLKKTPEQVKQMIADGVKWARSFTTDVEFSAEDASRSDRSFLAECVYTAIQNGASTINLPDTVGYAMPDEHGAFIADIIKRVQELSFPHPIQSVVFSVHCHNDLGCATANSLAGIKGGARQVECTINGLGERAGNAALEEIVMALRTRQNQFNMTTRIQTPRLTQASRLVEKFSGLPVQYNKPIVGRNAFAHASGIHQDGMAKNPQTYEIMTPDSVGAATSLPVTRLSGHTAVQTALKQQHIPADAVNIPALMKKVKAYQHKIVPTDLLVEWAVTDILTACQLPHADTDIAAAITFFKKQNDKNKPAALSTQHDIKQWVATIRTVLSK